MPTISAPERVNPLPTITPTLSIVTAAFNEEMNLSLYHREICKVLDPLGVSWELIVVDDHSKDATFSVLREISARDGRVRGLRLSRNVGSHTAFFCGYEQALGECILSMAADLQNPPSAIPELLERWRAGVKVVWAARGKREGEPASAVAFSRLYHWIMRNFAGIHELPPSGADFFLMDRLAADALLQFKESNTSILVLLTWIGFRQETIYCDRPARLHGSSGWSLEKKIKLVIDSITAFTYRPIRLMTYFGFLFALLGFMYAAAIVVLSMWHARPVEGWSSLMVVVLVVGGVQMIMMGVLGEYLWRTLDEARRRPKYLIEALTPRALPERHAASDIPAAGY